MTATEEKILQALESLEATVKSMSPGRPNTDFLPLFARLDELTRELPPGTSPDLLHYLHKKSYAKARLWLLGREAENQRGTCDS